MRKYCLDKNILDIISDGENFVGNIPMYLSFVSKDEAEDQTELMNEASTLESMKQAYVFSEGGRYLARDKLDNMGLQERSLPCSSRELWLLSSSLCRS